MELIALKEFSPDGVLKLKVNDKFEMSEASGRFLIATKHAKLAEPAESEKQKRYNRRDLRAEE
jgi:hypothetical protein